MWLTIILLELLFRESNLGQKTGVTFLPSRLYLFMINSPYTVYFQQLSSKPTKSVNLKKLGRKRPAWGGAVDVTDVKCSF